MSLCQQFFWTHSSSVLIQDHKVNGEGEGSCSRAGNVNFPIAWCPNHGHRTDALHTRARASYIDQEPRLQLTFSVNDPGAELAVSSRAFGQRQLSAINNQMRFTFNDEFPFSPEKKRKKENTHQLM